MDRLRMIGQKLVTGLPGTEITEEFRQLVKEHKVGNVILFARNIESPTQLRKLTEDIQQLIQSETGLPAFIAMDQEGGNLTRLHEPATVMPGAMGLAAAGEMDFAREAGRITGIELLACGVNMNLAPVMDVNNNPDNPVIGARSFGSHPEETARFGCAMAKGLREAGVVDCAKHFPGHGDTWVDSHLSLPVIDKSKSQLLSCELIPFARAVEEGVNAVMTAHILFPQLEKNKVPATMSPAILQGLLRGELGFDGLIISDCMMMEAISSFYGTVEGTVAAVRAGVDLVLICHSNALTAKAAKSLMETVPDDQLLASFRRIEKTKKSLMERKYSLDMVGCDKHRQKAMEMAEASLTFAGGPAKRLPDLGSTPLFVGCEPYRSTQAADPSGISGILPVMLQKRFGGDALEISPDPEDSLIRDIVQKAQNHSAVVLSTFNARQLPQQQKLIRSLREVNVPVILIAMRDPYDLSDMADKCWCIAAYDYTALSVEVICRALEGKQDLRGKLPVELY